MEKFGQINDLLAQRQYLTSQLDNLLWGALELRQSDHGESIYLHRRKAGQSRTIYVGPSNPDLIDQINRDNLQAREVKQKLRQVNNQLNQLGYSDVELSDAVKRNIDYAKRNLVNTIYDQAILEGVAVTFPETETIINGGKINKVTAGDVEKSNNLKHAWQFILDPGVITSPDNLFLLQAINRLVIEGFYYNAGQLRTVPVKIGDTSWQPPIPVEAQVREELGRINRCQDIYQRAVSALLYITRSQLFIDGNKRTSVIFANHILIADGAGLIVIPENLTEQYKSLLVDYYKTNDGQLISEFLMTKCLTKLT